MYKQNEKNYKGANTHSRLKERQLLGFLKYFSR